MISTAKKKGVSTTQLIKQHPQIKKDHPAFKIISGDFRHTSAYFSSVLKLFPRQLVLLRLSPDWY